MGQARQSRPRPFMRAALSLSNGGSSKTNNPREIASRCHLPDREARRVRSPAWLVAVIAFSKQDNYSAKLQRGNDRIRFGHAALEFRSRSEFLERPSRIHPGLATCLDECNYRPGELPRGRSAADGS